MLLANWLHKSLKGEPWQFASRPSDPWTGRPSYRDILARVGDRMPWQAFTYELRQTLMYLHFEITGQLVQI
jgi:hypothetical protein